MRKRTSFLRRYVLLTGVLLLAVNILMSGIDIYRSSKSIRSLVNNNMLNVASTAAGLIDGDALGALTEADVGGEAYSLILYELSSFQKNADIQFIYAVRQTGPETFVFLVDADPDDPADFGEKIVVSEGLKRAGRGESAVDDAPLEDEWGNFYSSYSPVFDSAGKVAGVIGVDFDAAWYNAEILRNTILNTFSSVLSVLVGMVVLILIARRVRLKVNRLNEGLLALSDSVDALAAEVDTISGAVDETLPEAPAEDEMEELVNRIQHMQANIRRYMAFLKSQAYVDALTRVGSSAAYHERMGDMDARIARGDARFSVAVFDINSLKEINDTFGHERGDDVIRGAGSAISGAFGVENTFRIGGDEFAVVAEAITDEDMRAVDEGIAAYNAGHDGAALAISRGRSEYRPGEDGEYKAVFARADQRMYEDKRAYYEAAGNRRRAR